MIKLIWDSYEFPSGNTGEKLGDKYLNKAFELVRVNCKWVLNRIRFLGIKIRQNLSISRDTCLLYTSRCV